MKTVTLAVVLAIAMLPTTACTSEQPAATREADVAHTAEVEAWRSMRLERLQAPTGWLSLVGLHWIEPGTHRIGSAADNDIVLATGPAQLGVVRLDEAGVHFTPAEGVGVTANNAAVAGETAVPADSSGGPMHIDFNDGQASFQVIERGGRYGLRVRDAQAPTRTGFRGIEQYPIDAGWRFDARFEPNPDGTTIDIVNVLGMTDAMPNPGALVFERDGKPYRLQAVDEGGDQLFVIFADRTNRKDTYGAGRFVYVDRPVDGRTVLDFNYAYNPPCAFTAYSTCPLPPPENRLDLEVTAGEKRYHGDDT